MSYLRWMPTDSQELFTDAVKRLDFRIRRLEAQRADMSQRFGVTDPHWWAYPQALPTWVAHKPHITDPIYDASRMPYTDLEVDFTVPTDESFLYVVWGAQTFVVWPSQPDNTNSGSFDGPAYTLSLDGVEIMKKTRILWASWSSFNLYAPLVLPMETYTGAMEDMRPIPINAGDHTLKLSMPMGAQNAGVTTWALNRYINGFIHA